VKGIVAMAKVNAADALPDLEKLGYSLKWSVGLHAVSSPSPYYSRRAMPYFVMRTPNGERKVKVHARTCVEAGRYWHGIAYLLFDEVDEFVLWHQGESELFIVPASFLKQKWIECGRPHEKTQWVINLCVTSGYVDEPSFSIRAYAHRIPYETRRQLDQQVVQCEAHC
jgi:hypothetical protein